MSAAALPTPRIRPLAGAVFRGALAGNRVRTALSVVAIALGVALGYAVALINHAAVNEISLSAQTFSGAADLEIRGARGGFDESLYPATARLAEVAVASPMVEVDAKLVGRDESLRVVGIDVFRAGYVQPDLVPASTERLDTVNPDALFLSAAAASSLDVKPGDVLRFQVGLHEVPLRVTGLLAASARARMAVIDIAGAQEHFDRLGRVTRIDLRLRPGTDIDAFRARLARELPPGVAADRPEGNVAAVVRMSRSYRVNLNVLALVALFTGGLLVFSTQALAVVRRRGQFALLRVLGLTRRQLMMLIVAEAALTGVAGSALGTLAGHALAWLAVQRLGADLGSGFFRGLVPELPIDGVSLALFFALGIAAAVAGSFVPALDAARAAPARALSAGDEDRAFARLVSAWPGLLVIAVGALLALLPAVDGLPIFGYAAIALLLIGTLMLMPRFAGVLLALAPAPRGATALLAVAQLRRAPARVGLSLATIVASASLMVSMAIMVSSFRQSLDDWLVRVLPADLYLRAGSGGDTAYIPRETEARIGALPGLARVEFLREHQLLLDASRPRVVLLVRPVDPATFANRLQVVGESVAVAADAPPPIWVSEAVADIYGYVPGRVIELPLSGKAVRFTVAGVFRDYARQQGALVIDRDRYVAITGDRSVTNAALWLARGTSLESVRAAIVREVPGGDKLETFLPGEIRAASLRIFDRTFAITYALELAAVVIGLVGLSSTFGALVLARRREFGVLRHIGMTRRQIGAMLATEGLLVSTIGLIVGLVLGLLISLILIHVVNRQSFHWGMDLAIPWGGLGTLAVTLLLLATATAVASGRQAMGSDAVRAVKDDW